MYKIYLFLIILIAFIISFGLKFFEKDKGAELTYSDLIDLLDKYPEKVKLKSKVNHLLNNVVVKNIRDTQVNFPKDHLRVAQWNIERGYKLDEIKSIFSNPKDYIKNYIHPNISKSNYMSVEAELKELSQSDVLLLSEVDWGVDRTDYLNVIEELAKSMNANYAYAVEFIELSPLVTNVDKKKYKGLHGNAVISKLPIKNARVVRLPVLYDWYHLESKLSSLSDPSINEIPRELRFGSRVAVIAELQLPIGEMVVVSVHLEDRSTVAGRQKQLEFLFNELKDIKAPVILGGDLNTLAFDGTPDAIKKYLNPSQSFGDFLKNIKISFTKARKKQNLFDDHLLQVDKLENFEEIATDQRFLQSFEKEVQTFTFIDTNKFISESSQASFEKYISTFKKQSSLGVANYKLDWLMVKPGYINNKVQCLPIEFKTLNRLNYSHYDYRLSDHSPIFVDIEI